MTCIVGLAQDGHVFIGGDSAGISGFDLTVRSDQKVFRNGEFLFGFTTSFRMGQLLRFNFIPPERQENTDDYKFLVTSFIDAIRRCLKDGGYATIKDGSEHGGTFILGYRGKVYCVDDDYQVASSQNAFVCCGCGNQVANGSMFSTAGQLPQDRITMALKAAEHFSAGVRGPFTIMEI